MGKLIQCAGRVAKVPYHFRLTKTNVYSIEEVCYYIRHNIYMMQEEIFDRNFVMWVRSELHMEETADKLERLIQEQHDIRDIVVTICCSCDYYEEEEIKELVHIMEKMDHLPMYERKKRKGDHYLCCQSYEKAIEEYEKIFESDEILQAEAVTYGALFHNMGVAYVNIGEFHKASELFLKAYEKNNREESLAQCLYALRLCKDVKSFKKLIGDLEISNERQGAWEKEYQHALKISAAQRTVQQIERLRDLIQKGNVEEYYNKVQRFIMDWKEEYRRQISV